MLTLPTVPVSLASISLLVGLHFMPAHSAPLSWTEPAGQVIVGDPPRPPATVQQLVQQTPYLVRGRVRKVLPARLWFGLNRSGASDDIPVESRQVVQPVDVEVLEILRDEGNVIGNRKTIQVLEWGGSVDVGGKLYRTHRGIRTPIQEGEEVILFLAPSEQNSFVIKYGAAGSIVIPPSGTVPVPSALSKTSGFAGQTAIDRNALLNLLKGAIK